jgi:hypothetical protein
MFLKGKVKKQSKEHYYTLQHFTSISPKLIESNPKWAELKNQYLEIEGDKNYDWTARPITSFCNAVLTQERIYFIMGRDSFLKRVVRIDDNWSKNEGMANGKWETFVKYLTGEEGGHTYIELYKDGDNNTKIYKLIDEDLLSLLRVNEEKQLEECLIAAEKNDKENSHKNNNLQADGLADGLADEVISNKVISNKVISDIQNQSLNQKEKTIDVTLSILFREEFGINKNTEWSEINGMIKTLAPYAVENIGIEDCTKRDFINYLKELTGKKKFERKINKFTGWSQEGFANLLAENFEKAAESYAYHRQKKSNTLNIVKPRNIDTKKIREQAQAQHTVEVLKAAFSKPTLEVLHRKLEKADSDEEKEQIMYRIKLIERVC